MTLYTEAFNYTPISIFSILLNFAAAIFVATVLMAKGDLMSRGLKIFNYTMLALNVGILLLYAAVNLAITTDRDALSLDLKDQLGIEKVSYSDDYRSFTGEKDGTVVTCLLAEEGDAGFKYEVVCK